MRSEPNCPVLCAASFVRPRGLTGMGILLLPLLTAAHSLAAPAPELVARIAGTYDPSFALVSDTEDPAAENSILLAGCKVSQVKLKARDPVTGQPAELTLRHYL